MSLKVLVTTVLVGAMTAFASVLWDTSAQGRQPAPAPSAPATPDTKAVDPTNIDRTVVKESRHNSATRTSPEGRDGGAQKPLRSLVGHKERVTAVAYSPDGRWIATAAWDGTARLWDAQTGKEVQRLEAPPTRKYDPAYLSQVLFSPDNAFVVTAQQAEPTEFGVIIWNRRTGKRGRAFSGSCMAASPDGRQIACGEQSVNLGVIRIYEFESGKFVRELGHQTCTEWLPLSSDGNTLVSRGGEYRPRRADGWIEEQPDVIHVWNVATGEDQRSLGLRDLVSEQLAL